MCPQHSDVTDIVTSHKRDASRDHNKPGNYQHWNPRAPQALRKSS